MRKLVLKNFNQIFDLSTGFCSVSYWNIVIETNCFAICHEIFDDNSIEIQSLLISILILMEFFFVFNLLTFFKMY